MPVNAAQLMVTVGANTAAAEQGIMGFARLLGPGGVLGLGALGAAAAVAGIGIASTKMAGDFQSALTQIQTGAGELPTNMRLIHDGVLQMAKDTGTSTKQLTDGLYMIESANIHGAAALDVLKAAAEGAKVGGADLGVTADAVTTIMKDYKSSNITAAQATNILIATVAQGKTHLQDLAGALANILPTAQSAGIGLSNVMAAMAAQTAAGIPAADAATHLRQMLIALQAPSAASQKALEGIGLTTEQVNASMKKDLPGTLALIIDQIEKKFPKGSSGYMQAIKEISGGSREMQGMLALTGDHLTDFTTASKNLTGTLAKGGDQIIGWSLVQGTFNQKMSVAAETVKALMIQLGEHLLPVASQLADAFTKNLNVAVDALTGKSSLLTHGLGGDLMNAARLMASFFTSTVLPAVVSLGRFFETTIVPILHTFAEVLIKNVLPAILPVVKTILTEWLPPLERIMSDVLPVLNPLLQALGWLFQNVVGPGLNLAAKGVGGLLGGIADLVDGISAFVHNPSVAALTNIMKGIANAGNGAINVMTGGIFSHGLPHFATGGVMENSGLALVGEQGPELVSLPGGAQVTPLNLGLPAGMRPANGGLNGSLNGQPLQVNLYMNQRLVAQGVVQEMPDLIRNGTGNRSF